MARVNHKLVKQRLNEERSKITDRQFFSSRLLAGHYEDLAAAQTRRYHYNRRVRVNLYWKPKDSFTASTDNMLIRINAGNPLVTQIRGRENRYQIVTGMFAHELGHVLHTDFLAAQTYGTRLGAYKWYPYPPELTDPQDIRNEKAFWAYAKADPKNLEMIQMVAHHIANVIEDGYVENRILSEFPGTLGFGLEQLRKEHFELIPTVTQMIEAEEAGDVHTFESILQIMLSYAKFGEIKYGDEPLSDVRIQLVFSLLSEIDAALMSHIGKDRLDVVNLIMVRCWQHLESYLDYCKERQEAAEAAGGTVTVAETLSELLGAIAGGSQLGTGNTAPVAEQPGSPSASATAAQRAKTHSDASESEDGSPQTGTDAEDSPSESGEAETGSEAENGAEENEEINPMCAGSVGESSKQEVSESEGNRMPYTQSEILSTPAGGTIEYDPSYERQRYERAASDIERILDKMAEKAVCKDLENDRIRELNDAAQSISYGNIHEGVNVVVKRIAAVDEELVEQYEAISSPLLAISSQLQKSLMRQLKENRRGGKQTGLLMGRRLDVHALCRNDGKVFYKNSLPNEIPELAVGLLLDESGSMSSCDRCTYARASAIILYDFCRSLHIPVMVYGHSTGYNNGHDAVELFSYAEFEAYDQDDKYRMMDIAARGSNRDGAAIRYVAEQLSKRPEAVKMLIVVSDGQPADTNYYGSAAEEDLRGIKQEYQRKGVLFVAAAIGDDKQNIERIYGDSFMDITDLNQLPVKLTGMVKRHIRV